MHQLPHYCSRPPYVSSFASVLLLAENVKEVTLPNYEHGWMLHVHFECQFHPCEGYAVKE